MIIDTSAIIAILRDEDDAERYRQAIARAPTLHASAATVLETALVLGPRRREHLARWLGEAGVVIAPFDTEQLAAAIGAHARFGRGSGSAASLNFGDCFPYALARCRGEPLLFKGVDFGHTDIQPALAVTHRSPPCT